MTQQKKKLTEKEKEMINSIGKAKFVRLHLKFWNKMCKDCRKEAHILILNNKSKEIFDTICDTCQIKYANLMRKHIQ